MSESNTSGFEAPVSYLNNKIEESETMSICINLQLHQDK